MTPASFSFLLLPFPSLSPSHPLSPPSHSYLPAPAPSFITLALSSPLPSFSFPSQPSSRCNVPLPHHLFAQYGVGWTRSGCHGDPSAQEPKMANRSGASHTPLHDAELGASRGRGGGQGTAVCCDVDVLHISLLPFPMTGTHPPPRPASWLPLSPGAASPGDTGEGTV